MRIFSKTIKNKLQKILETYEMLYQQTIHLAKYKISLTFFLVCLFSQASEEWEVLTLRYKKTM